MNNVQTQGLESTKVETFAEEGADVASIGVKITISGVDDAPVITGATTGAVTEDGPLTTGNLTASGRLTLTDPDGDPVQSSFTPATTVGTLGGRFDLQADGSWTYTLDNSRAAIKALSAGQQMPETFTAVATDGTSKVVTITVTGANDAPVIGGSTTGAVTEDDPANTASGTLTATDTDQGEAGFRAGTLDGVYGSLALQTDGRWTYTLDNGRAATQGLTAGLQATDSFTVRTTDGTPTGVTITVTGASDGASITAEQIDAMSGAQIAALGNDLSHLTAAAMGSVDATQAGSITAAQMASFGPNAIVSSVELSAVASGTGGFVINGEVRGDLSGYSVSNAGDVNGDGLEDLLVGAPYANVEGRFSTGRSYVVFGKANSDAVNLSAVTAGTGGFVINGRSGEDWSGYSVSNAGDVNGDGLADLIIGVPRRSSMDDIEARSSFVVFGKSSTSAVDLSAVASGTGGFVINLQADYPNGQSVSTAGDVNGDGLADLIIVAPDGTGESFVVFGKANTSAVDVSAVASGTGGFVINGQGTGNSVSNAGDVNGDGLADLIVGAPDSSTGAGPGAGSSYVVFGKSTTSTVELSSVASGTGGFVINGQAIFEHSGYSVSNAGDVNGDGLDDLIVGAPHSDPASGSDAGRSYVVYGKSTTSAVNLSAVASGTGGFAINGQSSDHLSGFSVSAAGDVNGDGLADLIVGAPFSDPASGRDAGRIYVVYGKSTTSAVNLSAVASGMGGFAINGQASGDLSGFSVSAAGDVNGDGLADLIVGAPESDPASGDFAGRSYVIYGRADLNDLFALTPEAVGGLTPTVFGSLTATQLRALTSAQVASITAAQLASFGPNVLVSAVNLSSVALGMGGFVINGEGAGDRSGHSVSNAGDVNGDGLDDLIVGAPDSDLHGHTNAGRSYVVFGTSNTGAVNLSAVAAGIGGLVINGRSAAEASGYSVSNAGDVNGDGLEDLIVGAPNTSTSAGLLAGRSYVVFGKADTGAVDLSALELGAGGFVIDGQARFDTSGVNVSSAGDVNGDGLADLIVGSFEAGGDSRWGAGRSYVVYGKSTTSAVDLSSVALGTGGFLINGQDAADLSGLSVSNAGDVNGDGLADLIVGAPNSDPDSRTDAGRSYVVFGRSDFGAIELSLVASGTVAL